MRDHPLRIKLVPCVMLCSLYWSSHFWKGQNNMRSEIKYLFIIHYSSLFSTLLAIFYLSAELLTICGSGCLEIQKSKIGFKKGTWRSSDKSKRPAKSCGKRPSGAGCECVPVFSGSLSSVPLLAAFDVLPHLQVHLVRLPVCGKRSMKSIYYFKTTKPWRVRKAFPLLPQLFSDRPNKIRLKTTAPANVPEEKPLQQKRSQLYIKLYESGCILQVRKNHLTPRS